MARGLVYLVVFWGVFCMSTASIMIRMCTAPALVIAFYRVLITSLLALVLSRAFKKQDYEWGIIKDNYIYVAGAGLFLALHFAFWITSLSYTSVSSSVLFTNLQVIFVMIFSFLFLHEKLGLLGISGIIIALCGSAFIAGGDLKEGKLLGDMLSLLSGFFIALYFIISRRLRDRVDTFTYMGVVCAVAAVVLLGGNFITGHILTGYPTRDWLLFFLLALIPGIGGHASITWALKYIKAPIVAVSVLGESVGASILAYLFFNESLMWYQWIGGTLIIIGIYMAAWHEYKSGDQS
ncbi:Permease of the drug/metabolite transporter (DMT) superfamily [Thermosyntropha lipolytica DSM 11003]|uniref:Permease of the drug/metabolite transporter (DMT) superfamily n=1 Tax=Thermosyntropha lipolytica DSM 11003 TaxID=1123382 RepID=A0A1M5LYK4_9FIRM|nr:DMT family transporter [Thermosyntropha lipolytica]SHG70086.1 Permease of the drug/metabolite transporter (DMT) superfamily [Thermosyntropha lipolytica DSM 11003]